MRILKLILFVFLTVIVLGGVVTYFGPEHQAYLQFDRQRAAWHQRCDGFGGQLTGSPDALDCQAELAALVTLAKSRGWN